MKKENVDLALGFAFLTAIPATCAYLLGKYCGCKGKRYETQETFNEPIHLCECNIQKVSDKEENEEA